MVLPILDNDNLKSFIMSLGISPEQEKILLEEIPSMDEKDRLELLSSLKDVYILNEEKKQSIAKTKTSWKQ